MFLRLLCQAPNSNYIEITSTGVKICGNVALATANHTHIYDHIQVATVSRCTNCSTNSASHSGTGWTKTSTPDKVALKLKGDETTQVQS